MSKAVCKDNITTLLSQICSRIICRLILRNIGLLDHLALIQTECLHHTIDTFHMSCSVAFVLITYVDNTYLEV